MKTIRAKEVGHFYHLLSMGCCGGFFSKGIDTIILDNWQNRYNLNQTTGAYNALNVSFTTERTEPAENVIYQYYFKHNGK